MIGTTVDPRLVERRGQVRAEARRGRIRRWMALGVAVLVIAVVIGAVLSPLLDVDHIKVRGASRLSSQDVAGMTRITHGDHLTSADLGAARTRLREDPWIASAQVTRHFPGTVDVRIIEEQPLLEFAGHDGTFVVSRTGRILAEGDAAGTSTRSADEPALPRVEYAGSLIADEGQGGARSHAEMVGKRPAGVLTDAVVLVKRIPADLLPKVLGVRMTADKNMTLALTDGAEVRFGQPDDIEAKMIAMKAVLSQVVLDCLKSIDVREPTRAAVSRGPGCPGVSPEPSRSTGDAGSADARSGSGSDQKQSSDRATEGT